MVVSVMTTASSASTITTKPTTITTTSFPSADSVSDVSCVVCHFVSLCTSSVANSFASSSHAYILEDQSAQRRPPCSWLGLPAGFLRSAFVVQSKERFRHDSSETQSQRPLRSLTCTKRRVSQLQRKEAVFMAWIEGF